MEMLWEWEKKNKIKTVKLYEHNIYVRLGISCAILKNLQRVRHCFVKSIGVVGVDKKQKLVGEDKKKK